MLYYHRSKLIAWFFEIGGDEMANFLSKLKLMKEMNYLLDCLYDDEDLDEVHDETRDKLEEFLDAEFDPKAIVELLGKEYALSEYDTLLNHGIDIDFILDVFDQDPEMIDRFLDGYGYTFASDLSLLPASISVREFLEHFSIKELRKMIGDDYALADWANEAGYGDEFTRRFVNEVGYTGEYKDSAMLLYLVLYGYTNDVDFNKFAESIEVAKLDRFEKEDYLKIFLNYSVSKNILEKFSN
jgi:hypothetical protein